MYLFLCIFIFLLFLVLFFVFLLIYRQLPYRLGQYPFRSLNILPYLIIYPNSLRRLMIILLILSTQNKKIKKPFQSLFLRMPNRKYQFPKRLYNFIKLWLFIKLYPYSILMPKKFLMNLIQLFKHRLNSFLFIFHWFLLFIFLSFCSNSNSNITITIRNFVWFYNISNTINYL